MRATDYVLFSIDVHTYMVIYMIETRIIIAVFNSHYPLRAELGKILEVLVLEYDFGGTRTRTRTRETAYLPSSGPGRKRLYTGRLHTVFYCKSGRCFTTVYGEKYG
jgi:hypothetical protein